MKHNKNQGLENTHGFTLIELLAVIVVLAIVALIAFQAVLPLLGDARRNAFAIEVNNAVDATATWFMRKALTSGTQIETGKCVEISTLIDAGVYDADKDKYTGWVEITKNTSGAYLYKITMTNGIYSIIGAGLDSAGTTNVNIKSDDSLIKEGTSITKPTSCTDINTLKNK